jgi:ElaB/YqjD/DUF883 family membrane-anchored ribosome-binding protein
MVRLRKEAESSGSADRRYQELKTEVESQLEELRKRLEKHHAQQANSQKDWGNVGNLGHVSQNLKEILEFLEPQR